MSKVNRCVVRVQPYTRDKTTNMERHNERKNEHYGNGDVDLSRVGDNVHFKKCEGTYLQAFDKLVEDGDIHLKHLKKDGSSNILNELIFDVNTEYFEDNGGYDYAKTFFEEAYRMAVKEAGGEQYVLSAVMHADERNKAMSEKLGRDVYHYHLHVIFVPVVQKEVKWTKRCKDPALVGTVKEVIAQVSNANKWKSNYETDENGKKRLVYSYSLLQDRYFEHMKEAGFIGFERGERGSTAQHLDVLDYKIKQDEARAADLDKSIKGKEQTAAKLDEKTEKKKKQYDSLEKKTAVKKEESAMFADIDNMAKPAMFGGNLQITPADWKTVSNLAKEGVKSKSIIADLKSRVSKLLEQLNWFKNRNEKYEGKGISDNMKYFEALQRAPKRLAETVADIMRKPPEQERKKDRTTTIKQDLHR